jgi:N-methyl-L-proline demethylase
MLRIPQGLPMTALGESTAAMRESTAAMREGTAADGGTTDPLLQPFRLGPLTLRNRVVVTAHEGAWSENGMPTDRYRAYHVERAKGGVAMTMTAGSAVVSTDSPPSFGNLHAYDDAIVPWIRRLTDGVHEHGAACMIQLTHLGRRTGWGHDDWLPVLAPSAVREAAHRSIPKVAEQWDLDRIVADFADAAERMQAGGMDGIELEAYGHLLDGFWSPLTNRRDDSYGGSLANRMRFSLDVLNAIRQRVGRDFVVAVRMSFDEQTPGGITRDEGLQIARTLTAAGLVDLVNVIRGRIDSDAALSHVIPLHGMASAPHLAFAGEIRQALGVPVLHAAKIDDVSTARYAVREGLLDLVGMTRAHLADPHLVRKLAEGRSDQIRPCVGATYCLDRIYESGEALCIHNPSTGRELTLPHQITTAAVQRRVLVVGAGPAGLEAARVCAERGHDVELVEAMPDAGGQLLLASRPQRRRDLRGIVDWRVSECRRLGVRIRLDTVADTDLVHEVGADVVLVATGGQPRPPELTEGDRLVTSAWDVLSGQVRPTGSVLLWDDAGTHASLTVAEHLAATASRLEILTPERTLGVDVGGLTYTGYATALVDHDVRVTLNRRLLAVRREGGRLVATIGSEHSAGGRAGSLERTVDHVVAELGTDAEADLYLDLVKGSTNGGAVDYAALTAGLPQPCLADLDGDPDSAADGSPGAGGYLLFRLGDAVASRNVHAAIYDAQRLCATL